MILLGAHGLTAKEDLLAMALGFAAWGAFRLWRWVTEAHRDSPPSPAKTRESVSKE